MQGREVPTAYSILGLTPEAGKQEIKSAYRSLARRLHPDVYKHVGHEDYHPWPPVQRSYEILTDDSKRLVYDDVVMRGRAARLADPERFERWWAGHIRVDYETGTVHKGSEFFHQMGSAELRLLHNRHRIGWACTAALAGTHAARAWRGWGSPPADETLTSLEGRAARTAFIGGLLGGTGASWGQLVYGAPIRSVRTAGGFIGFAAVSACVGALSLGPLCRVAAGHEPKLADHSAIVGAYANRATVYQSAGMALGAAHAAHAAPTLGRAHLRVAAASIVGGAVGLLCDRLLLGRRATSHAATREQSQPQPANPGAGGVTSDSTSTRHAA
jgi:hypothetical protein